MKRVEREEAPGLLLASQLATVSHAASIAGMRGAPLFTGCATGMGMGEVHRWWEVGRGASMRTP